MRKSLKKLGNTKISSIKNGNTNTRNVGYNEIKPKRNIIAVSAHTYKKSNKFQIN